MNKRNINKSIDRFLNQKDTKSSAFGNSKEESDVDGGCDVIISKDGIIERMNKRFITEDGRQLLQD